MWRAAFVEAGGSLRARDLALALALARDLALALALSQNNIQNVHAKVERLADCGILVETEPGLFTQPGPWPDRRPFDRPIYPDRTGERDTTLERILSP